MGVGLLLSWVVQAATPPAQGAPAEVPAIDCKKTSPESSLALWKQGEKPAVQKHYNLLQKHDPFQETANYVWSGLLACPQEEGWWVVALEWGLRGAEYPFPWKEKKRVIARDLQGLAQVARNKFPKSVQVALAWAETKQTLSAAQAVHKMIPEDPRAHVLLGRAQLLWDKKPQEAVKTLQGIVQPDAYALLWLAVAQLANGFPEEASATLRLITKKKIQATPEGLRGDHRKESQEGRSVLTALVLLAQDKPNLIHQGVNRLRVLEKKENSPDVCTWVARAKVFDKIDILWNDTRISEKDQGFLLKVRDGCYFDLREEKLSM